MSKPESFWPSDMREQIKDDRDRENYMEAQAELPKKQETPEPTGPWAIQDDYI